MKKKLLSLVMVIGCGVMHGQEICEENIRDVFTILLPEDLEKPMGSLGESIQDIDKDELRTLLIAARGQVKILTRALQEKNIDDFDKSNLKDYEKALVEEFSGKKDAINQKYEDSKKNNQDEENKTKNAIWDGSYGWVFSREPTTASYAGNLIHDAKIIKNKKDDISTGHKNLVTQSKDEIIGVLDTELGHQVYLLEMQFLKALQVCQSDSDCLARRKVNWQDIQRKDFFAEFATEVYASAINVAQQKGVQVSSEDMKRIAAENTKTAHKHKKLFELQSQAEAELNKILNPQLEPKPQIDLTGENKEKPAILENTQEDQK